MDRALSPEQRDAAHRTLAAELSAAGVRDAEGAALEAVAVLDALVAADRDRESRVDRSEAMALGALLGRRLAGSSVSVTATLATIEALGRARRAAGGGSEAMDAVRAVVLEGYTASVHELALASLEERNAARAQLVPIAPDVVLCPMPMLEDPDRMSAAVDALGRALLSRDPQACIVVVTGGLSQREAALGEGLATLVEHTRMIGAAVVVVVTDGIAREALRPRIDAAVPFADDVGAALGILGRDVQKRRSGLARWLPR